MTRQQLHQFKKMLEAQQAAAAGALNEDRMYIIVQRSADLLDEISYLADRDLAIASVNRSSGQLRHIRMALARIEEGEFGTCLDCGEAIGLKRLMAVPWAPLCVGCQEAADGNQKEDVRLPG